jgi:hypothetical protein
MPFDEQVSSALSAVRPQLDVFRFAVSSTLERAKAMLTAHSGPSHAGAALGNFATGRIDPDRFAMISAGSAPLDSIGRTVVERAILLLEPQLAGGDGEFVVDVKSGTSPGNAIRARLTKLGSVFAAATLIELVRRRVYDPTQRVLSFGGHPFDRWNAGERKIAPPLVIRLEGADLDPFEIAPFLDGCVRLVFKVDGQCAPAPLARLISPGVFVAQTSDTEVLAKLTELDAPAIVAVMSGNEARFVHDPRGGTAPWQRLQVSNIPSSIPRKPIGNRSAWQLREDLAHLEALAKQPLPLAPLIDETAVPAGNSGDPAERLAAWLLDQSSFSVIN